jgi:hypothetical protein
MVQPGTGRLEEQRKVLNRKNCGKKEKTGDFRSSTYTKQKQS